MRLIHTLLGFSLALAACDLPDIGDSGTTTGGDPGPITTSPPTATTVVTASDTAPPGGECPPFDAGPVGDPNETYGYQCLCESCELSFDDIPLETVDQFGDGLCECLCAEAGCGGLEGEGGVASGSPTETGPDPDCGDTEGPGYGSSSTTSGDFGSTGE